MLNLNNLSVSETHAKSCAIDFQTKFLSFSHCGQKNSKNVRELGHSGCKLAPPVNPWVYHYEEVKAKKLLGKERQAFLLRIIKMIPNQAREKKRNKFWCQIVIKFTNWGLVQ